MLTACAIKKTNKRRKEKGKGRTHSLTSCTHLCFYYYTGELASRMNVLYARELARIIILLFSRLLYFVHACTAFACSFHSRAYLFTYYYIHGLVINSKI